LLIDVNNSFDWVDKDDAIQKADYEDRENDVLAMLHKEGYEEPGNWVDYYADERHVIAKSNEPFVKANLRVNNHFLLEKTCPN
jgi:hypothetical protein